jgi:hypothetical protein
VTRLIDDQLVGTMLRGRPPRGRGEIFTTGYWYVRLCLAVLGSRAGRGVLPAPFGALPLAAREEAIGALIELPEEIGLVTLRDLGPVIGQLRRRHDLNILGMEVLAAATYLEADVFLSAASPRLQSALKAESRRVEIIA